MTNQQPRRERRQIDTPVEQPVRALTTSTPISFIRALFAFAAAYGSFRIALDWSAYWTLVFAVDIVDVNGTIVFLNEAGNVDWSVVPTVAIALVVVITLAPALLISYAAMPSTPLIIARAAFGMSALMSLYDILSTFLGFDVVTKVATEAEQGLAGFLTAFGVGMTSVLASFADEAMIVFLSMGFAYAYEGWLRWKGKEIEIFRSQVVSPTLSGLERILRGDGSDTDNS